MESKSTGRFSLRAMLGATACLGMAAACLARFIGAETPMAVLASYELGALAALAGLSFLLGFCRALAVSVAICLGWFAYIVLL